MRAVLTLSLFAAVCVAARGDDKPADLKTISYADLGKVIRSHKGKVVVVDIWAFWCPPCKKKFPDFLALGAKYAEKGLVCISVSLDDAGDEEKKAIKFLTDKKSTIPNYRIAEGKDAGLKKFGLESIPAMYIFDKENRRAGKFTNDDPDKPFTYEKDIEPLVVKLLEK
jgi:thiol-disulfide isomerase/thioredoxin